MTRISNANRKWAQRERARTWLMKYGFTISTAEALLTAIMKQLDAKQVDTLRRMVEQKGQ